MIWNCPHCKVVLSLGIDLERTKRTYVRCGKCSGVALLVRHGAYAGQGPTKASTLAEVTPPPFIAPKPSTSNPASDAETMPMMMSPVRTVVVSPPDFTPPAQTPPAFTPDPSGAIVLQPSGPVLARAYQTQGALKKESDDADAPANDEPAPPAAKKPAISQHQFEFRESHKEISRIYQFPKPPEFLTRQNELLEGAFQTVNQKLAPKKSQKPLSIAVVIAALIAIGSGVYLFVQGQKLLQEGRHTPKKVTRFSQQEAAPPTTAPRYPRR